LKDFVVAQRFEDGAKMGRAVDAQGKRVWFKIQDWYWRRDVIVDEDGTVPKDVNGNPLKGSAYKASRILTRVAANIKSHANKPVKYYRRRNNSKLEQKMKLAMMRTNVLA
jgi:hypothetical protein